MSRFFWPKYSPSLIPAKLAAISTVRSAPAATPQRSSSAARPADGSSVSTSTRALLSQRDATRKILRFGKIQWPSPRKISRSPHCPNYISINRQIVACIKSSIQQKLAFGAGYFAKLCEPVKIYLVPKSFPDIQCRVNRIIIYIFNIELSKSFLYVRLFQSILVHSFQNRTIKARTDLRPDTAHPVKWILQIEQIKI